MPFGAGRLRVGAGEEEEGAGARAVRDPLLRAGDTPAVAVRLGGRAQRAGVGAGVGLGERERAELLAPRERRHEACLLLLGSEREDRKRRRARVHGDRHADARVRPRELLEDEDVREEVRARAAVLLGDADAHEPELRELGIELVREAVVAVPRGRVGRDLGLGEVARERLDLPLVGGQLEVHRADYMASGSGCSLTVAVSSGRSRPPAGQAEPAARYRYS